MTTVPKFAFQDMDAPQLDDKMELASSPFHQMDDLELEFDQIREPQNMLPTDNVMDDFTEAGDAVEETMDDETRTTNDDVMSDGENHDESTVEFADDLEMDIYDQNHSYDEDIIYDDDEEGNTIIVHEKQEAHQEPEQEIKQSPPAEETFDTGDNTASGEHEHTEVDDNGHSENRPLEIISISEELSRDSDGITDHQAGEVQEELPSAVEYHIHAEEIGIETDTHEAEPVVEGASTSYEGDQNETEELGATNEQEVTGISEITAHSEFTAESEIQHVDDSNDLHRDATHQEGHEAEHDTSNDTSALQPPVVHPVKLIYLGEEMALFPSNPETTDTFFLSDVGLVFEGLHKLLESCRELLTGSIGHDDELVLDIPSLGLHIYEDSKYASQMTLAQIIDVFLILNHNERKDPIEPLYCTLNSRVCLGSQFAYLSGAAQEGKAFSEIAADYEDTPVQGSDQHLESFPAALAEPYPEDEPLSESSANVDLAESHDGVVDDDKPNTIDHASIDEGATAHEPHPDMLQSEAAAGNEADEFDEFLEEPDEVTDLVGSEKSKEAGLIASTGEADTNSSHTAQADSEAPIHADEIELAEEVGQPLLGDDGETGDSEAYKEDQTATRPDFADQSEVDDNYEPFVEEELFAKSDDELDFDESRIETAAEQQAIVDDHTENSFLASNGEHDVQPQPTNGASEGAKETVSGPSEPTLPVTPGKAKSGKRKVLDDDDGFNLLDNSTPEPKRRRPS